MPNHLSTNEDDDMENEDGDMMNDDDDMENCAQPTMMHDKLSISSDDDDEPMAPSTTTTQQRSLSSSSHPVCSTRMTDVALDALSLARPIITGRPPLRSCMKQPTSHRPPQSFSIVSSQDSQTTSLRNDLPLSDRQYEYSDDRTGNEDDMNNAKRRKTMTEDQRSEEQQMEQQMEMRDDDVSGIHPSSTPYRSTSSNQHHQDDIAPSTPAPSTPAPSTPAPSTPSPSTRPPTHNQQYRQQVQEDNELRAQARSQFRHHTATNPSGAALIVPSPSPSPSRSLSHQSTSVRVPNSNASVDHRHSSDHLPPNIGEYHPHYPRVIADDLLTESALIDIRSKERLPSTINDTKQLRVLYDATRSPSSLAMNEIMRSGAEVSETKYTVFDFVIRYASLLSCSLSHIVYLFYYYYFYHSFHSDDFLSRLVRLCSLKTKIG